MRSAYFMVRFNVALLLCFRKDIFENLETYIKVGRQAQNSLWRSCGGFIASSSSTQFETVN